ncbi:DUF5319 domain-containing protein [Corynebacterium deserti]|uniref:DUF5319 domain-containing protein n=1 Tax=Corynebacterium deserti TaxID=1408191 RepID=UPI0006AD18A8|nr:DUF5319 domain-containing protein [Corynebacterium deserti]
MNFDAMMPRDPFADDPNDPASFITDDDPIDQVEPLSDVERLHVEQDLKLVMEFKSVLGPRGFEGIFFMCDDCEELHYYEWDIMAANMRATLNGDMSPVHEPSIQPRVEAYVPWDYCLGYLDGLEAR